MNDTPLLDAQATAQALPYPALTDALRKLLQDPAVRVPPRLIQPLPGGASLFVMPAHDAQLAITKLITFVPGNAARGLPSIQGDIVVFDVTTGRRLAILDGPTVTARRTAAVSVLAAQLLAPRRDGPLLIVGAGVQGHSHLEAFQATLGLQEAWIASRSSASAEALVQHARQLGLRARRVDDANAALADCPLVVTATPAQAVVMHDRPRADAFVAAVGAFNPRMRRVTCYRPASPWANCRHWPMCCKPAFKPVLHPKNLGRYSSRAAAGPAGTWLLPGASSAASEADTLRRDEQPPTPTRFS